MLALTYPDGARVQRCDDYLPENPAVSLDSTSDRTSTFTTRLSRIPEIAERVSYSAINEFHGKNDYKLRFRRRLRRDEVRRSKVRTINVENEKGGRITSATDARQDCRYNADDEFSHEFKCESTEEDKTPSISLESSQSTSRIEAHRLSVFHMDYEKSMETRRHELPGRESWPGGSHPKDQSERRPSSPNSSFSSFSSSSYSCCSSSSFLQLVLIIILIIIASNRHCGQFGRRFNHRTGFGAVLTMGTIVGCVNSAPVDIVTDTGVRSERSANLSHITGTSRKIQMFLKNRHLQILPDGTVNGTNNEDSDYTIIQRASVSRGQLRIQGVATCLYLCMDSCGFLYGSRECTAECLFNETLESNNYNTYSSVHWSTPKKTLYVGLTGRGQPRRVQAKGHNLGRLSAYAKVLTPYVPQDRVDALYRRMLGTEHNVRHHHGNQQILCPASTPQEKDGRDKFRCRKRKKRKKRRRKCRAGETPGPQCDLRENNGGAAAVETQSKRSCEGEAVEEACRKEALDTPAKKRKSRIEEDEETDVDDEVAEVERKSRRSNVTNAAELRDRGQRKKGKKSGNKKKKNSGLSPRSVNGNNASKNGKQFLKNSKKRANQSHGSNDTLGRFVRTTYRLSSSPAMTSPISFYPGSTSPTLVDESLVLRVSNTPGISSSSIFSDRPKSSSSSSSAASAVSLAATSIASTLTFTVAGGQVFSEAGDNDNDNRDKDNDDSILDFDEFVDGKESNDNGDEEEDDDNDDNVDNDDEKTDLANFQISNNHKDQRLAM